jgi:hypothetical protein
MGHQLPELGTRNSSTAALLNASLKSFAYDCRPHLIHYAETPESKNGAIRLHLINCPRSGKTGFYAVRSLAGVESTKLLRAGFASSGLAGKYAIHDGISFSIGQKRRITKYILSMKVRQRALNQIQELPLLTRFQPGVRTFGTYFQQLRDEEALICQIEHASEFTSKRENQIEVSRSAFQLPVCGVEEGFDLQQGGHLTIGAVEYRE